MSLPTQTEEKKVRKQLQARYLTLETRKDGTKFTSRALRDAAEGLQTISRSYSEKQAQLVDEVGCLLCSGGLRRKLHAGHGAQRSGGLHIIPRSCSQEQTELMDKMGCAHAAWGAP